MISGRSRARRQPSRIARRCSHLREDRGIVKATGWREEASSQRVMHLAKDIACPRCQVSSLTGSIRLGNTPITPDALSQPSQLSFIANDVASALASAVPVAPTMAPPGAPFSAIYAFGDSLTDGGNDSLATAGLVPMAPYADRSFTNGQVWVKDLAQDLGLPALNPSLAGGTDFAYGGAETGQTPAHTLNPTDLSSQISQFASQVPSPQAGALLRRLDRFKRRAGYRQQHHLDDGTAAGRRRCRREQRNGSRSALWLPVGAENLWY